ncbi:hypothetical protein OROMI_020366 [Orobanche minor]
MASLQCHKPSAQSNHTTCHEMTTTKVETTCQCQNKHNHQHSYTDKVKEITHKILNHTHKPTNHCSTATPHKVKKTEGQEGHCMSNMFDHHMKKKKNRKHDSGCSDSGSSSSDSEDETCKNKLLREDRSHRVWDIL